MAVIALALALTCAVFVLRLVDSDPAAGVFVLLIVPIAICAVEFGFAGGITAAAVALVLIAIADVVAELSFGPLGYLSRGATYLVVGGLLGSFVTRQRKLERQVMRAEEMSLDLLATASFDGSFTRLNPAWQRALGYTEEELCARPFTDFVHPDDRERTDAEMAKLVTSGEDTIGFRNRYLASDGSVRHLEWNSRAIADEQMVYAVARDITDRAQAEAVAAAAKAEAERANHSKSEFLSRMSHELRTPLNSILGFGQLLQMEELDTRQRESVDQILRAGRHLLELINDVLDISRIEAGTLNISLEPVDVVSVLRDVLGLVGPLAADHKIELIADLEDAGHPYALADRHRLRQVLLNLLSNAVKYNREGGNVRVSVEAVGERIRITVRDSGMGISEARFAGLFRPFDRLGAEQTAIEGTGLGLVLSKRLVEAMGGSIGVASEAGVGSTFSVDLDGAESPMSEEALDAVRAAGHTVPPDVGSATLLYVEDNLANLKLIEHIFAEQPGLTLLSAMHGGLGLELARMHRPDLILLDLHLPDMTGDDVLARLREDPATGAIPVIVLSADATDGRIARLLQTGATAYLTKPLDVEQFLATVGDALEGGPDSR
ncbi:MAG: PAS domain-containing hybrid sensor histidine kinase/response regulator [Solirubrobacteraceae bacterium]